MQIERELFYPKEELLAEIVNGAKGTDPDYITFVGDGEPTLYRELGWLIRQTKIRLGCPTAVITNGSLLSREDVRRDLGEANTVIPSLDAGCERTFRAVNRPHGKLEFHHVLRGLETFRRGYRGQIWLEVMLVKGLNDTPADRKAILRAIEKIRPNRVYAVTPTRPPAEAWVRPPDPETILQFQEAFAETVPLTEIESGTFGLGQFDNAEQAIVEIGSRHPLRQEQIEAIEQAFSAPGTVGRMLKSRELIEVRYDGRTYLLPKHFVRHHSQSNRGKQGHA